MLVSHRKNFIYAKTVKTGGTSVEICLEKFCLPPGQWNEQHYREETITEAGIIGFRGSPVPPEVTWYNHMPAAAIRKALGPQTWEAYYKFCIVRSPYEKMISGFLMIEDMRARAATDPFWDHYMKNVYPEGDPVWMIKGQEQVERFRSWVAAGGWIDDRDKYFFDGEPAMDFFIRYETLHKDLAQVYRHLGETFDPEQLPSYKVRRHKKRVPTEAFYDAPTLERVAARYQWELETFHYSPPKN